MFTSKVQGRGRVPWGHELTPRSRMLRISDVRGVASDTMLCVGVVIQHSVHAKYTVQPSKRAKLSKTIFLG